MGQDRMGREGGTDAAVVFTSVVVERGEGGSRSVDQGSNVYVREATRR